MLGLFSQKIEEGAPSKEGVINIAPAETTVPAQEKTVEANESTTEYFEFIKNKLHQEGLPDELVDAIESLDIVKDGGGKSTKRKLTFTLKSTLGTADMSLLREKIDYVKKHFIASDKPGFAKDEDLSVLIIEPEPTTAEPLVDTPKITFKDEPEQAPTTKLEVKADNTIGGVTPTATKAEKDLVKKEVSSKETEIMPESKETPKEMSDLTKTMDLLSKNEAERSQELTETINKLSEANHTIEHLKGEVERLSRELELSHQSDTVNELESQHQELTAKYESVQTKLKRLEEELFEASATNRSREKIIAEKDAKIKDLESKLHEVTDQLKETEARLVPDKAPQQTPEEDPSTTNLRRQFETIKKRDERINKLEAKLEHNARRIDELEKEISAIQS